ncbi:Lon protease [compost metagenome]
MKNVLEIIPVSRMGEVLEHALIRVPEPIEWDPANEPATVAAVDSQDEAGASIAH